MIAALRTWSRGHTDLAPIHGEASTTEPDTSEADPAPNLALPWVIRLRYGMVVGGAVTLLVAARSFSFCHSVLWVLLPLLSVLATNLWLHPAIHRSLHSSQALLGATFAFDTLCLTAALALTGGPMNPFSLLYLVQITLAAVVLNRNWTWILVGLSAVSFGLLFFLPSACLECHVPGEHEMFPHLVGMWFAFIVAATLISFFTGRISNALRHREQEILILQNHVARQERLTSLVTLAAGAAHELSTPLGTIAVVARELERYAWSLTNGDDLGDDARLIRSEVERCQQIVHRMSAGGAEPAGESPRIIQTGELLGQALDEISESHRARVSLDAGDEELTLCLPVRATVQSLTALLRNASMPEPTISRSSCRLDGLKRGWSLSLFGIEAAG